MTEEVELYKKYRPKKPADVVGQKEAMSVIGSFLKNDKLPQVLLFTGASGCGKTTVGRILRDYVGCKGLDYTEINASSDRGIDMVRDIGQRMRLAPVMGKCRMWFIDEAHAMTPDAQNAFLKDLEDTPPHVRFILGTTDPHKLKNTIKTRCTQIEFSELTEADLVKLVNSVAEQEKKPVDASVAAKIAKTASGSARKAMVLLHAVIDIDGKAEQINAIEANDPDAEAIDLVKLLLNPNSNWKEVGDLLNALKKAKPESVRHLVLAYCTSILIGGGRQSGRAAMIIDEFRDHFFDSVRAGLVLACYNVVTGGD